MITASSVEKCFDETDEIVHPDKAEIPSPLSKRTKTTPTTRTNSAKEKDPFVDLGNWLFWQFWWHVSIQTTNTDLNIKLTSWQ